MVTKRCNIKAEIEAEMHSISIPLKSIKKVIIKKTIKIIILALFQTATNPKRINRETSSRKLSLSTRHRQLAALSRMFQVDSKVE